MTAANETAVNARAATLRQLVVAALLKDRGHPWTARRVQALLVRHGYRVERRPVALELERLYREGSVVRGREGRVAAYRLVTLPQKAPGTIARLNHLRRTWREADSCARKTAALDALRDDLAELAQQPVRGREGADEERAREARNRRYRRELENKQEQTRGFCQRAEV